MRAPTGVYSAGQDEIEEKKGFEREFRDINLVSWLLSLALFSAPAWLDPILISVGARRVAGQKGQSHSARANPDNEETPLAFVLPIAHTERMRERGGELCDARVRAGVCTWRCGDYPS